MRGDQKIAANIMSRINKRNGHRNAWVYVFYSMDISTWAWALRWKTGVQLGLILHLLDSKKVNVNSYLFEYHTTLHKVYYN